MALTITIGTIALIRIEEENITVDSKQFSYEEFTSAPAVTSRGFTFSFVSRSQNETTKDALDTFYKNNLGSVISIVITGEKTDTFTGVIEGISFDVTRSRFKYVTIDPEDAPRLGIEQCFDIPITFRGVF